MRYSILRSVSEDLQALEHLTICFNVRRVRGSAERMWKRVA